MRVFVTIWYWTFFLTTLPFSVAALAVLRLVTFPFDRDGRAAHWLMCHWAFNYVRCWPGWRVKVEGRENFPDGPCVIVVNHQSAADSLAVLGLYRQFKFVAKRELFSVPIAGWAMSLAGYMKLNRGNVSSTRNMIDECSAWLKRGMPVLLFPEGTYAPKKGRLPFKRGASTLAIEMQVPVVPVVLTGTTEIIAEEDGALMKPWAKVTVRVCPPIQVADLGTNPDALSIRLREFYVQMLGEKPVTTPSAPPGKSAPG